MWRRASGLGSWCTSTMTRKSAQAVNTDILADWLTVEDAAARAGVSEATIIMWIEQGRVPAFYVATETETVH